MHKDRLKYEIKKMSKENGKLFDQLYEIDCHLIQTELYSRQENIEIMGIPEIVTHKSEEKKSNHLFSKNIYNIK